MKLMRAEPDSVILIDIEGKRRVSNLKPVKKIFYNLEVNICFERILKG